MQNFSQAPDYRRHPPFFIVHSAFFIPSAPQRTEPGIRTLLRPCQVSAGTPGSTGENEMVEHQGIAPCIPVWKTGVYLSTPMLEKMESRAGIAPASAVLQTAA